MLFRPLPTPCQSGVLPLAFSIIDLSTTVLKGETKKPDRKPATTYNEIGTFSYGALFLGFLGSGALDDLSVIVN